MMCTIRRMMLADKDRWAGMRAALWPNDPIGDHRDEITDLLQSDQPYHAYLALSQAQEPVGFAELSMRTYANGCTERPVPFLEGIWVAPAHRHKGVGGQLIATIERDLHAQGFSELCSDAEIENSLSHNAHKAWGFEETERVIYFRKALKGQ